MRRIVSILLATVMLLTSVDITAFAKQEDSEKVVFDVGEGKAQESAEQTKEPAEDKATPEETSSEEITPEKSEIEPTVIPTAEATVVPSIIPTENPTIVPSEEATVTPEEAATSSSDIVEETETPSITPSTTPSVMTEDLAISSVVASGECGDNLTWSVDSDGVLTISGTGDMYDYNLSKDVPWGQKAISSLKLEKGITHIGNFAFSGCSGFVGSLTIPESVTSIGEAAFSECSGFTGSLTIPGSVKSIGSQAFIHCSGFTGNLTIPESVTSIGFSAFSECNGFTGDLIIPDSVKTIGEYAFYGCSGFTGNLVIGNGITNIPKGAFKNCSGFKGNLIIGNNVEYIDNGTYNRGLDGTFEGCSGFSGDLIIPDSVKVIDVVAFRGCSGFDGELVIGKNVNKIGNSAFCGCTNFTGDLVIPDSVTEIGEQCFNECRSFDGSLYVGNNVEIIGYAAFVGCGFTGDLCIGGKLTELKRNIFETVDGTGFDGTDYFEVPQFSGYLTINEGVTTIGDMFFMDMPFTGRLNLPNSLVSIGRRAFENTQFVGDLVIPDSVVELGGGAFYNSGFTGKLYLNENITVLKNDSQYDYGTFEKCGFKGEMVIPDYMEYIGGAFKYCEGITSISIPSHVAKTTEFTGCIGLKSVDIVDSSLGNIEKINDYMFDGCYSLESISFPDSVNTIGKYAFRDCKGFLNLDFFNSVSVINDYAFQGCSSVQTIVLPECLKTVGYGIFRDCDKLKIIRANCSIEVFSRYAIETIRAFNSDGVKVIYADGQDNWCEIAYDETYGITNAIAISYSEYINSDGLYPSDIYIPQNCFGICAIDATTGRLIRKATITIDGIVYETDLEGVVLIKSAVDSVQHIASAQAGNYYESLNNYYMTQLGVLTCIKLEPIEIIEDITRDDVIVDPNMFAIYAVDTATGKVIQNVTINVDGKEYKPHNGILYVEVNSEETNEHRVFATADGYLCLNPVYTSAVYERGKSLIFSFVKSLSVTYVVGMLENHSNDQYQIDGTWYDEDDVSDASTVHNNKQYVDSLINNYILCWLRDGKVSVIKDIKEFVELSALGSSEEKTFTYQNGKFINNQCDFNILLKSQKASLANELSLDIPSDFFNKKILRVNIYTSEQSNLVLSKDGQDNFTNSIVIEMNGESVNLDKSTTCSFVMKLKSNNAPTKSLSEDTVSYMVVCDDGSKYTFFTRVHYINADLKQSIVEETKKKNSVENGTPTKDDIYSTLQNNLLFNFYNFETDFGMTNEQVEAINELLTLWLVNIDATTDTAREISGDEKFVKEVLGKLGVNINSWLAISKTTAQIKINADTEKYGSRTFCFVLDMQNYHWNDEKPYAKFGAVDWYVEETNGIPTSYRSGTCAMIAKADPEKLINQIRDLSIDSIKNAYNSVWGNSANKVASEILDKRILDLIGEKYDNTSNMIFTLLLDATKTSVNSKNRTKTITKCPVDLYIYDSFGNLAGAIINNVAYPVEDGILVYMDGESKVVVYYADEYTIKFVGTGTGTMSHEIYEYRDTGEESVRYIEFNDIPLEKDMIYYEYIPNRLFADSEIYELEGESGEVILPDTDTHISEALVYVESILIDPQTLSLKVGDAQMLKSIIGPENASTQFVRWQSDDDNIATVDDEGKVVAVSEGNVTISAISVDGRFDAECVITVENKLGEVTNPDIGNSKDIGDVLLEDIPENGQIPDGIWTAGIQDLTYSASNIKQSFRLYDGKTRLKEKKDYTVSYKNNKNAYAYTEEDYTAFEEKLKNTGVRTAHGTFNPKKAPQVVIKMKGNYSGSQTVYFRIEPEDITGEDFAVDDMAATYSGKKQTPVPVLTWKGKKLKYGTDFYVPEYDAAKSDKKAFTSSGTYDLTITGKKNFTGEIPITLTISESAKQIAMNKVAVKGIKNQLWTGSQIKQTGFTVKYKKDLLSEESGDYTVSYGVNTDVGTGTITFTGTETDVDGDGYSYVGTKTVSFKITGKSMKKVTVSGMKKSYVYTGAEIEPTPQLSYKAAKNVEAEPLTENVHYTVTYQNNKDKGTATILFTGLESGGFTGTKKVTFKITPDTIADNKKGDTAIEKVGITFKDTANVKDGIYHAPYMKGGAKPEIIVTGADEKGAEKILTEGKDYTVTYSNNKAVALSIDKKAPTITIKGKGNYSGSKQVTFTITAKALSNENGIVVEAKDKIVSAKKNGYKQSFKVYDADGKALGSSDYDTKKVTYTLIQTENEDGTVNTVSEVLDKNSIVPANAVIQITVQGKGIYAGGSATGTYRILENSHDIGKATIQINNQSYTGQPVLITDQSQFKTGKVYIKINKKTRVLTLGEDIEVVPGSYVKNVNKGTAKVTFRGINEFGGVKTVSFKIGTRSLGDFWKGIYSKISTIFN